MKPRLLSWKNIGWTNGVYLALEDFWQIPAVAAKNSKAAVEIIL
jgi:hypothetical protein